MRIYDRNGLPKNGPTLYSGTLAGGLVYADVADTTAVASSQIIAQVADADGIALAQGSTAATPLTLEAVAADLLPSRQINLTSAGNLSAVNYTIAGLDEDGLFQTYTIAGPNASTVTFTGNWSVINYITPDATNATNITAGWPASAAAFEMRLTAAPYSLTTERYVTITSSQNLSAVNFLVSGTNWGNSAISESITGPNIGTTTGLLRFKTVTSILPSSFAVAGSASAGIAADAELVLTAGVGTKLSNFFLFNNNAASQTVRISIRIGNNEVFWKQYVLAQNESASPLSSENEMPLESGNRMFISTTTDGALSYSIHGEAESGNGSTNPL